MAELLLFVGLLWTALAKGGGERPDRDYWHCDRCGAKCEKTKVCRCVGF